MSEAVPVGPPYKQLPHRYDGLAKVTGKAKYAAEFAEPFSRKELLYGYMVQSTIPCGTLLAIDQSAAEHAPGVAMVVTPFNAPKLAAPKSTGARRNLSIFQDTEVHYNGQPIAVVLAKSLEQARYAATLLKIRYEEKAAKLGFRERQDEAHFAKAPAKEEPEEKRGDLEAALAACSVIVDETYTTPVQNHNAMEPHATLSWWEGDKLNVHDSTANVSGSKQTLSTFLNVPFENIRVQCPYTGGAFGSKSSAWSHVVLSAMCARIAQRPVKLVLDRPQMFGPVGTRPATVSRIRLGANAEGKILGVQHDVVCHNSVMEEFTECSAGPTRTLYETGANHSTHKLVNMNVGVTCSMRAPGESTGLAALESAMDELAYKLKLDPLELRLRNYAEKDFAHDRPFTSKHLRQCYAEAAERFGWEKRHAEPGQRREGSKLIGYGMATALYAANRFAAKATVTLQKNGRVLVQCGSQDLGTGTYTLMAHITADALRISPELVDVQLGDTDLPLAPGSGSSRSTASIGPAIHDAAVKAREKLLAVAGKDAQKPLAELAAKFGPVLGEGAGDAGNLKGTMTSQSWGAVFAEVAVDVDTHMVQVRRVVATYDIGTLMNKTAGRSQLMGGVVWGIGFALHEESVIDPVTGRTANGSLAEYHVAANADVGTIDVTALDIADTKFNPLGARGCGEIGNTGTAAAIANAVFHATGKRVREYPITPDKILRASSV